jgi:hypothetical protein
MSAQLEKQVVAALSDDDASASALGSLHESALSVRHLTRTKNTER